MKIALSNDDLKAAVTTVAVAASGKSPLPILNHLLLQADCGRLRVSATDLEIAMTRDVTATVTDTGGCAVPARLLSDLVSQLEDGEVKLELDGYRLTVQNRSSRYRLNVLSADEFPILADTPDQIDVRIDVSTLHTMLSHVKTCVAPPCETRESIKGVLVEFEFEGATLSATTTDGRRLAHIEHKQAGILFDSLRQMPDHVCKCSCASSSDVCDCECDCDFGQDIIAIRTTLKKLELKVDALTGARPAA